MNRRKANECRVNEATPERDFFADITTNNLVLKENFGHCSFLIRIMNIISKG